jgi:prepilin-type N-terminal cleavage/methylation domain-containing protein
MYSKGSNGRGFTLIELIVVIGIVSIIMGVAIPAITTWLPKYKVNSAARDIGSTMQMARLKAAGSAVEYRVVVNKTLKPFSIQVEKGNTMSGSTAWTVEANNYKEFENEIVFNSVTPSSTEDSVEVYRLDGTTPNAVCNIVRFSPNGSTAVGSEVNIRLTSSKDGAARYAIRISNTTGRVKVDRGW